MPMCHQSGNTFSEKELERLTQRGAVAEIGQRFLDADGCTVETALNERVIGITLKEHFQCGSCGRVGRW